MTVRLGLVGAGAWGRNFVRTVPEVPGSSISCVCRMDPSLRPDGLDPGIPVTSDFDALLRLSDAVIVATPPDSHPEYAIRAVRAGLPVLVEKPAALSLRETEAMFEEAAAAKVPLLVDHVHLFSQAFPVLREWTRSWSPVSVSSVAGGDGPFRPYSALLDWGPHDVAMCAALLGRPDDVEIVRRPSGSGELAEIFLGFGSSFAHLTVGNGLNRRFRRLSVRCGDRTAVYDDVALDKLLFDGRPVPLMPVPPLQEAVRVFVDAVRGKDDWRLDPSVPLIVAEVLEAGVGP